MTYEESVRYIRTLPEMDALVTASYLDDNAAVAAKRFAESEEFRELLLRLGLKSPSPKSILDVGCGNGIASYAFATFGLQVTAVDPDSSSDVGLGAVSQFISQYESRGTISVRSGAAESLPFPDESFDIVYARQALHHFSDLEQGLRECARVLKSGGIFAATREHVVEGEAQLEDFLKNHPLQRLHGGEMAYPTARYLSAIEGAGLNLREVLGPFDSVINHFPQTNDEVREWFRGGLRRRFGRVLATALSHSQWLERAYRQKLSRACDTPGRMYSFFAVKPI